MAAPVNVFGTVPVNVSVAALNFSQDGNAVPFERVAWYVRDSPWGSTNVLGASERFTACPSFHVWPEVWLASAGAAAGVATENVSDTDRPLVSVAVTLMLRPAALFGTVPVNVSVAALKLSQDGNAAPFESVAWYVRVSCCGSVNVSAGSVKFTTCPSFQVWGAVAAVTLGGAAGVEAEKISEADKPLVSVAVTSMLRPDAVLGTVPVNVPVVGLNVNQDGNGAPLDSVAL